MVCGLNWSGGPNRHAISAQGRCPPAAAARSGARHGIEVNGAMYFCQERLFWSAREGGAYPHRALRCETGPIARERAEICDRRNQRSLVILHITQPKIAAAAQQASDHAGQMAMIDAEPLFPAPPADRARAVLLRQQRVVFSR